MGLRAGALAVPARYFGFLGAAAAVWLAGALVWAVFLLPELWKEPPPSQGASTLGGVYARSGSTGSA